MILKTINKYNPLCKIWKIILINLFCQIDSLTEILVFIFKLSHKNVVLLMYYGFYIQEQIKDDIIKLIF